MKIFIRITAVVALLPIFSLVLLARTTHSEEALWIKISEHGKLKTTIAVTEKIARLMAESDKTNVHFRVTDNHADLFSRQMMLDVLNGRESSVTANDSVNDTEAEMYMKKLNVPGSRDEKGRLILETFKEGERTFRMKLGEFSFETKDEETGNTNEAEFSWKGLLPFLSETGGGVYIHDHKDDTEVWIYVE
jgi:hypothetical protein